MPVLDAGSWLSDERILRLLAYSIYNPTPERVRERVQSYIQRGNQARAYMLNDEVLGIVVFALYDARAEIVSIATDPAHRRHGIARRLIYGIAAEYPVREIYAETDDDAVGFYSRCGFEVRPNRTIGEVQRYACVLALPASAIADTTAHTATYTLPRYATMSSCASVRANSIASCWAVTCHWKRYTAWVGAVQKRLHHVWNARSLRVAVRMDMNHAVNAGINAALILIIKSGT